ncbi:MAG: hypothetical protein VW891_03850, partial [Novosphingobium sp.]
MADSDAVSRDRHGVETEIALLDHQQCFIAAKPRLRFCKRDRARTEQRTEAGGTDIKLCIQTGQGGASIGDRLFQGRALGTLFQPGGAQQRRIGIGELSGSFLSAAQEQAEF